MNLEDVADIHIGVVLKRKEAVYKGSRKNEINCKRFIWFKSNR